MSTMPTVVVNFFKFHFFPGGGGGGVDTRLDRNRVKNTKGHNYCSGVFNFSLEQVMHPSWQLLVQC